MKVILLLLALASPASAVPAQVPSPPAVVGNPQAQRPMLAWMPGEARCGGDRISVVMMRRPYTTLGWASNNGPPQSISYRFRIDDMGRPLSIERVGNAPVSQADDIGPALASTRFAAGAAQEDCEVSYTARRTPLDAAPVEDLISYSLNPIAGPLPEAGWNRIRPAGATCGDEPRPQPLTQVFPDFPTLPSTPGIRDWSMVAYDQDASGRPINVRIAYGTRNEALDKAAVTAMKASRYSGGARTGCLYPYWRMPAKMAAPALPDPETLRPAGSNCPADGDWASRPALVYPEPYRRCSIEGAAIVAFDVAPWGETGNLRVVASEPSDDFGRQAMNLIRNAKKAPSASGHVGCIERVRFVMAPTGEATVDHAAR